MSNWVVDGGDSCPKCGDQIEISVEEDIKFDTEQGIELPEAEDALSVAESIN